MPKFLLAQMGFESVAPLVKNGAKVRTIHILVHNCVICAIQ